MVTEITNERLPEHLGQVRPNYFFSRAPSIRNNSVWILSRWLSLKFHVATVQGSNLSKDYFKKRKLVLLKSPKNAQLRVMLVC